MLELPVFPAQNLKNRQLEITPFTFHINKLRFGNSAHVAERNPLPWPYRARYWLNPRKRCACLAMRLRFTFNLLSRHLAPLIHPRQNNYDYITFIEHIITFHRYFFISGYTVMKSGTGVFVSGEIS